MSSARSVVTLTPSARVESVFPTLTAPQIARVAAHGSRRPVRAGEILASAGEQVESFFVVIEGSVELARLSADREEILGVLGPGQFTGETTMLSGRQALATLRVGEAGE